MMGVRPVKGGRFVLVRGRGWVGGGLVGWADFGADGGVEDMMRRHFDRIQGRGMRAMCGFCSCRAARPVCRCRWYRGVFIVVEFGRWIPKVVELCMGIVVTVSCLVGCWKVGQS